MLPENVCVFHTLSFVLQIYSVEEEGIPPSDYPGKWYLDDSGISSADFIPTAKESPNQESNEVECTNQIISLLDAMILKFRSEYDRLFGIGEYPERHSKYNY